MDWYVEIMAWSEKQRAIGRAEIQRRLKLETAATCRRSFLKAAGICIVFLLLATLGAYRFQRSGFDGVFRSEGVIVFLFSVAGVILSILFLRQAYKVAAKGED